MQNDSNDGINQIVSVQELKKDSPYNWKWNYWNQEIQNAITQEKEYLDDCDRIIKVYKAKNYSVNDAQTVRQVKPVYNVLYSNIETLKPLVFSRLPNPRIRRRNLEKSNVNKTLSIILERNVKRILEETDAQAIIEKARDQYLLLSRGIVQVLYKQEIIEPDAVENLEKEEVLDDQNPDSPLVRVGDVGEKLIKLDFVSYKDILFSPAETWEEVSWVAFRRKMTQDQLKERFGVYKGKKVSLEEEANSAIINDNMDPEPLFKMAEVWEIWDKRTNKISYWTAGYKEGLLDEVEDVYKLVNFFNIPKPLGINAGFDDILHPIPDYKYYEDQAKELDRISNRIQAIIPYISMGGGYNAALTGGEADNFLHAIDNYFPFQGVSPEIDIRNMIYERDIVKLSNVLTTLYAERQQTISAIQQITGISDIVRGQTQAQETATAQEIKGNFAVSRIQPKQKEVENFCRDIVRIIVELIAENFDTFELAQQAQLKVFDMDALAQQFAQEVQQMEMQNGQPMQPQEREAYIAQKLEPYKREIKSGQATTVNILQQANKILKDDKLRGWAIEVETDSTIKVDQNAERQSVLDFTTSLAKITQDFIPALQTGVVSKDAFKAILSYVMRRFDGSEEVEELLEDDTQETNPADAARQQMQAKQLELEERKVGVQEEKVQTDKFAAQSKAVNDQEKLRLDEAKAILQAETSQDEIESRTNKLSEKIASSNLENL